MFFARRIGKALLAQFPSLAILRTRNPIGQGQAKNNNVNQSTKDLSVLRLRHPNKNVFFVWRTYTLTRDLRQKCR